MGIQAWLMVIGLSAMTLIVWDGWRRKTTPRAATYTASRRSDAYAEAQNASAPLMSATAARQAGGELPLQPDISMKEALVSHVAGSQIGAATYLRGSINAREPVLIKGRVQGAVNASGFPVIVSSSGEVASYVQGGCIDIDGIVTGLLKANIKLTLLSQSRVKGSIEAPTMECAAGAWLQASISQSAIQQGTE